MGSGVRNTLTYAKGREQRTKSKKTEIRTVKEETGKLAVRL